MLHLEIRVLFCGSGKYHIEEKFYELTDHLGNVRATLSDRKLTGSPGSGPYYADIRSYNHPYPFGMLQPKRFWDSVEYRYGFNGMETDPEVKGTRDHHYTTHFRQYDPRIGRWWSHDPVTQMGESPYAAMFNNPVYFSDPMGNNPPCQGCPQDASEGDTHTDQGGRKWTYNEGSWVQQLGLLEPRPIVLPPGFKEVIQRSASGTTGPTGNIQDDHAFQGQDANRTSHNYIYNDPTRVRSASSSEVIGTYRVTYIGTAPTISAMDPLLSGEREARNNAEVAKYVSYKANQVMRDPDAAPLAKMAAGTVNDFVSGPSIVLTGEDAAGAKVGSFHRFTVGVSAGFAAFRILRAVSTSSVAIESTVATESLSGYEILTGTSTKLGDDVVEAAAPVATEVAEGIASNAAKASAPTGQFYSVAYEMQLGAKSYPGVSRYMHFKEANIALDGAMKSNPMLGRLGISVPRSSSGSIIGKSPSGWVWHHNTSKGVMQLVPKSQHPSIPGGIFGETMHPGGVGGYSIWGK